MQSYEAFILQDLQFSQKGPALLCLWKIHSYGSYL